MEEIEVKIDGTGKIQAFPREGVVRLRISSVSIPMII
jgi:hypothetical protein